MSDLVSQFSQICGQTWNSCVSIFEDSVTDSPAEHEAIDELSKSQFQKTHAQDELVRLERRQVEIDGLAETETPAAPEAKDSQSSSLTGLSAGDDTYLNGKYQEVDSALNNMMAQVNDSTRQTLGLKPGQNLPRPMTVYFGVSQGAGGHQTLDFQSVKAGPNFRHRIHGDIPMYRTSADLSVAARQSTHSVGVVPEVDLSSLTDGQHRIAITLNPDGTYQLVPQDDTATQGEGVPIANRSIGS